MPRILNLQFGLTFIPLLIGSAIHSSPLTQATVSEKTQNVRKCIQIDDLTTIIEEKSLSLLSSLQASQNSGGSSRSFFGSANGEFAAKEGDGRRLTDMQTDLPNGAIYYTFKLKPKEHLKITLKCETEGKVWLQFVKPLTNDDMAFAFRKANLPPKNIRAKEIEITNSLNNTYDLTLAVYGTVNYAFTLKIFRHI